jgi:hypothetical protein
VVTEDVTGMADVVDVEVIAVLVVVVVVEVISLVVVVDVLAVVDEEQDAKNSDPTRRKVSPIQIAPFFI